MRRCSFVIVAGFLAAALLAEAGCKRTSLSPNELDEGRTAIETGLQAWQKGEKPDALQKLNPPIRFTDDDWNRGMRLTEWKINYTNGSAGDLTPRCEVELSLRDRKGNKISRRVVYQVEKRETIAVIRDPYF